jgi:7-cyano-7-deazaguanine synthase in queuosine biosynthesis
MTSDTTFVTFYLKNGKNFKTVFFNYGKRQEKEILSVLKAVNERILK